MPNLIHSWQKKCANLLFHVSERLQTQAALRSGYDRIKHEVQITTPNNPAAFGYKIYSQCDEDGIIDNIFSRIGEGRRLFMEIGCSDGLENNSHALLLKGWRGIWIDADSNKIRSIRHSLPSTAKLIVDHQLVTPENIGSILKSTLDHFNADTIDFLSLDIDSDDLDVMVALLQKTHPRVICAEYNAKFPPPMIVSVDKNCPGWAGDDYHGASLMCFTDALRDAGYRLVACTLSGVNAFFVRDVDADRFQRYTVQQLYQPARYYLRLLRSGHRPSLKFLANALNDNASGP